MNKIHEPFPANKNPVFCKVSSRKIFYSKKPLTFGATSIFMNVKNPFLFCLLFCLSAVCISQPVNILNDSTRQRLRQFALLPDKQYSFEQILADSSLVFIPGNKMEPRINSVYWVKIIIDNPSQYSEKYTLIQHPLIDNTVYYYDQDARKWLGTRTGGGVPGKVREYGRSACIIQGAARNVIYVRVNISTLAQSPYSLTAGFTLEQKSVTRQQEQLSWTLCMATILVVLLFLAYNAIVFSNIRDRTYFYYLLVQLGGIMYIAATFRCFAYFIPWRNFHPWLSPGGSVYYSHLNMFISRMATLLILASYVQLTRYYLQTRFHLPRLDKVLKGALILWILFELGHNIVTFSGLKFLDAYILLYSNIGIFLLIMLILITAITARIKGVYAAKYFLWANLGALGLMMTLALYYIFASHGSRNIWMPSAAIISQAFMFSMALLARLRLVRKELADKQNETDRLKTEIEQLAVQQTQLSGEYDKTLSEIAHEKNRSEVLEQKLQTWQRELASATLYMTQKNELLTQLKAQIQDLGRLLPHGSKALKGIEANLQHNQFLDADWDKFKLHFEQVHPQFFEELKRKHPGLTQYEVRLCAYFHMNLSTKEIAGLLNIDPASVRRAKTRLNKKMNGALSGNNEE